MVENRIRNGLGIRITSINMTTDVHELILGESHNISVDLFVYHVHDDITGHEIKNYRWTVEMWVSQHPLGHGEKIQQTKQMLNSMQQRQRLFTDRYLNFTDLIYPLNLWSLPCSKIQYLCSSFKVRRRRSANVIGQITNCQQAPACKDGIVVRNVSFNYLPESGNYVIRPDGPVENLLLNVQILYNESVTGNITGGIPLWKIFVWTSTSPDGGGLRYSLKRNVLRPRQSRQGLVVGQNLTFDRVHYPLNPSNLSCLEMTYICVRFKLVAKKNYVILSRPNSSVRTKCRHGLFCLPPSTFDKGPGNFKSNSGESRPSTISGTNARRPPPITMKIPAGFFTSNPLLDGSAITEPSWTKTTDPQGDISNPLHRSVGQSTPQSITIEPNTLAKFTTLETQNSEPQGQSSASAIAPLILQGSSTTELSWTQATDPPNPQTGISDALHHSERQSTSQSVSIKPNSLATTLETQNTESLRHSSSSSTAPQFGKTTVSVAHGTYTSRSEKDSVIRVFSTQVLTSSKVNNTATPSTARNQLQELLDRLAEVTRPRKDIAINKIDEVILIMQKLSVIDDIPVEVAKKVILHTNDFMTAHILLSSNVSSAHNTSQISEHLNKVVDNVQLEDGENFYFNSNDVKVFTSDVTPAGDQLQSFGQIYPVRSHDSVQIGHPISIDSYENIEQNVEAGFFIPKTALSLPTTFSGIESVRVNFIVYQDSRLFDGAETVMVSSEASDDEQCFICSRVSSLDVRINGKRVTSLKQPASLAFNTSQAPSMHTRQCVWWDFATNGGYGGWSTEGCHVAMETEDSIICDCDHLTNFAVLMSPDYGCQAFELDLISKVGCALSVLALLLTLLTYLKFKKLMPATAQMVLIQWIFALLCLYTIFLFGIDAVKSALICSLVSASLHYFTLSYICWTSVEAVHMYIVLVQVMNGLPRARKFIPWSSVYAWGAPLCVVAVSYFTCGKELYSNRDYCFLRRDLNFFIVLLAPIAAILVFNVLCFLVIIYRINFRRPKVTMMQRDRRKLDVVTVKVKQALSVAILVGTSWVLGFFAITDGGYLFALLFCICNSLTGVFVFFVFCLFRKEVRGKWKQTHLCGCCFTTGDAMGRAGNSNTYSRRSTVKSHSITLEFMPRAMVLELSSPTISESLVSPLSDKRDLI
ncbi:Adhesion G-protein coupled receptor G4 [Holothuria leucospilota]|uniref:Adhesion G-protein coupled receptor G4 n=1 Tax=Holothuria leucospilota TaxID=206669 RepID=A0A9Q1BE11_HOLLE|nr:Adhesion G-protein coupled receptor G4 [Holothuria leucospilota]